MVDLCPGIDGAICVYSGRQEPSGRIKGLLHAVETEEQEKIVWAREYNIPHGVQKGIEVRTQWSLCIELFTD